MGVVWDPADWLDAALCALEGKWGQVRLSLAASLAGFGVGMVIARWANKADELTDAVYRVGEYREISKLSRRFVQEANHTPQIRVASTLIGTYNLTGKRAAKEVAILLPYSEHLAVSFAQANRRAVFGQLPASARELLAQDILVLRRFTNAPNSALQQVIRLNKERHFWDLLPLHRMTWP